MGSTASGRRAAWGAAGLALVALVAAAAALRERDGSPRGAADRDAEPARPPADGADGTSGSGSAVPASVVDAGDTAADASALEDAASLPELSVVAPLEASLEGRIAEESRTGGCAESYAQLRAALVRLVNAHHARVAGLVVPRQRAGFALHRVDVAARNVVDQLPEHPCRATRAGTWALLYDRLDGVLAAEMTREAIAERAATPDADYFGDYVDVRVTARGRLVFAPEVGGGRSEVPFSLQGAPLLDLDSTGGGMETKARTIDDLEAGDVDGDGVPEVLVRGRQGSFPNIEGADVRARVSALHRSVSGAIARVAGVPPGLVVAHLLDGDGDGLADLTSSSPYFGTDEGTLGDVEVAGPELLVHALRGGGYARDDAAARAYATKLCPARPSDLGYAMEDPGAPGGETPLLVSGVADKAIATTACALLWNVPGTTLRAWLARANSGPELVRWTRLAPPLALAAVDAGPAGDGGRE